MTNRAFQRLGSLDELVPLASAEVERQARHFESLDTKAGLLLGFAGLLVGLVPLSNGVAHLPAAMTSAAAAFFALLALRPREFRVLELDQIRDALDLPEVETRRLLLDTRVEIWRANQALLERKAHRLRVAFWLLFLTAANLTGGIVVETSGGLL